MYLQQFSSQQGTVGKLGPKKALLKKKFWDSLI
jgi:hypothetical protein